MKISYIIILVLVAASFILSFSVYGSMPDRMASHWNAAGEVNGYMSKFWGTFLMPIISLALILLFLGIPLIDPLRKNIKSFRKYYDWFIVVILVFLVYVHALTLAWNAGARFNIGGMMTPAMGLLFIYLSVLLRKAKRNWFIGIRTPWTLSSDRVWEKTHLLGSKLFLAAGIISFLGLLFPKLAIYFVLVSVLAAALITVVFSYFEYSRKSVP